MNWEAAILELYLKLEGACQAVTGEKKLRQRGPASDLTDPEVLAIEIFGEQHGHHHDASIWRYAKAQGQEWFPGLGSYPAFAKPCAHGLISSKRVLLTCLHRKMASTSPTVCPSRFVIWRAPAEASCSKARPHSDSAQPKMNSIMASKATLSSTCTSRSWVLR
jgi:hypothetical protein